MLRTPGGNDAFRRVIEEEEHVYLTLACKDGEEILVPDFIAFHSGYLVLRRLPTATFHVTAHFVPEVLQRFVSVLVLPF